MSIRRCVYAWVETKTFRALFVLWALAALGAVIHIAHRYPIGEWVPVAIAGAVAVGVVAAPMPWRVRLALAFAVGLAIRYVAWRTFAGVHLIDDPGLVDQLSNAVLAGRGLVVTDPVYGTLRAVFPPLYPLVLAAWKALGGHWLALNALIDLAAAAAIYFLSGRRSRAAAAYFLFPSVVYASILPEKEGLACLLVLVCMLLANRSAFLYGIAAALVALTQPAWILVPVFGFLLIRGSWRDCALAAIGGIIGLLPWWVRNAMLFGKFVPLTSAAGYSLAVAYNGGHIPPPDMSMGELERASDVARLTFAKIGAHPAHYLVNVFKMLVRAFMVDDDTIDYLKLTSAAWLGAAAMAGQLAWATLIAAAARATAHIPSRPQLVDAFFLAWAASCLVNTWLEFTSRHRAFGVPILILLAARYGSRSHRRQDSSDNHVSR